jgi:hypothetical protein
MRQVAEAFRQVIRTGDEDQLRQAQEILVRTRRALYLLLAGETDER